MPKKLTPWFRHTQPAQTIGGEVTDAEVEHFRQVVRDTGIRATHKALQSFLDSRIVATSTQPTSAVEQEPVYIQLRHKTHYGVSPWGSPLDPKERHSKWADGVEMREIYPHLPPLQDAKDVATPPPVADGVEFIVSTYQPEDRSHWSSGVPKGIRVTHKSGIFEECHSERSQHENRSIALAKLQARLVFITSKQEGA